MRANDPEAPLGGLLPGWFSLPEAFTVPVATSTVQLDQKPVSLAGTITVNGAEPAILGSNGAVCGFTGPAAFVRYRSASGSYEGSSRVDCTTGQAPNWTVAFPVHGPDRYDFWLEGSTLAPAFNLLTEATPVIHTLDVR
jgi:hypothetical protein